MCCLELELSRLSLPRWGKHCHSYGTTTEVTGNRYLQDVKTHAPSIISARRDGSSIPERVEMSFPSQILGKGSIKNDLKGSADFLVNPTKSPCIQTQSSMSGSRQSYTTDSPEKLCFSIITHLIQAGRKTKGQTASTPSSYHWQTHIPAG